MGLIPHAHEFTDWWRQLILSLVVISGMPFGDVASRLLSPSLPLVDYKPQERHLIDALSPGHDRADEARSLAAIEQACELFEEYSDAIGFDEDSPVYVGRLMSFRDAIEGHDLDPEWSLSIDELIVVAHQLETRGAIELIKASAATPWIQPSRDSTILLMADEGIPLGCIRGLAAYCAFYAEHIVEQDEIEYRAELLDLSYRLSLICSAQIDMMSYLVSDSIRHHQLLRVIQRIAIRDSHTDNAEQRMKSLMRNIEQLQAGPSLSRVALGELIRVSELSQAWYTDLPGIVGAQMDPSLPRWALNLVLSQNDAQRWVFRYHGALYRWLAVPRQHRAAAKRDVDELPMPWPIDHIDVMTHSYTMSLRNQDWTLTEARLTHLLLAVELHRARHGSLPESLDDLVPDILDEIPGDRFDPEGGFRYRVVADGADYLLYSVGFDGQDDGGAAEKEADHQALMGDCRGCDYVIHGGPTSDDEALREP